MNTARVHNGSKRTRIVSLQRFTLFFAAVAISMCICLFGGRTDVSAHDESMATVSTSSVKQGYVQERYKSIEVHHGDTLWSIAEEYMDASYGTVQEYIRTLRQINHLDSSEIIAGTHLMICYYE